MKKLILALTFSNLVWSQGFTIRTVAGSNAAGEQVAAQTAALASAEGIAVDLQGNVYIADGPDHRIRKIDSSGQISTVAGNGQPGSAGDGGPASAAQLNAPYGLALDLLGNLYVADLGNARVRRISAAGTITTVAGGGAAEVSFFGAPMKATEAKLNSPRNLAIDTAGQLYIADFGANRVLRLSTDGLLTHVVGSAEPGIAGDGVPALTAPLRSPTALVLDRTGQLYIADSGNNAIRRLTRGTLTQVSSTGSYNPQIKFATITGLAIDASTGDLYVAEGRDSPVRRLTPASEAFVFSYGARDVTVDAAGAVWLADGPFVRKLSSLGAEVIAGTGNFAFGGDGGLATEARLRSPAGVASDKLGNIYLADMANHRVRRVGTDGRIETLAGTGEAGYSGDDGPAVTAKLRSPTGLVLDAAGNVYVADTGNHAVRRINKNGLIETVAGTGTAGPLGDNGAAKRATLSGPQGLAMDAEGNLVVADTGNHRIGKVSTAGWFTVIAGRGVAANTGDGVAAKIASLSRPTDVTFDTTGAMYIADTGNRRIRRVTPQGIMNGFPSDGLSEPTAVKWATEGLYVADGTTQKLYLLAANGSRAEVAGTGEAGFSGDEGPAVKAQFNRPAALALAGTGDVLVADQENHRIRLLTRAGTSPGGLVPGPGGSPAAPGVRAVVSAASLKEWPAVPGSIMTLFGSGIGPTTGVVGKTDILGRWNTTLEGVEVQFDGLPAPLFYVQETQINLQVPRNVAGRARVELRVLVNGTVKGTRTVEVVEAAPAFFMAGGTQTAALNQDGGVNLPANAATRGSIVTLFATGVGAWDIDLPDGAPAIAPLPVPRLPVTVWIGGTVAELLYAGAAPGLVGLMQVNVRIPRSAPAGQVAIVLQIGSAASEVGPRISIF